MSYHTGSNNNNNRSSQQRSTPASTPPVTPTPASTPPETSTSSRFPISNSYNFSSEYPESLISEINTPITRSLDNSTQRSSSVNESASQSLPPANSNTETPVTMTAERAEEIVTVTNILTFDGKIYSILGAMHDIFVGENNYEKTIKDRNVVQAERHIGFVNSFLPEMRAYANHIRTNYDKLVMFDGNNSIPPIRSDVEGSSGRVEYWQDVLDDLREKMRECYEFAERELYDDLEICKDNVPIDPSDGFSEEEELAFCCGIWSLIQAVCAAEKTLPCLLLFMEAQYATLLLMLSAAGCDCTTMSGKNDGSGLGTIPTNEPYPGYCRETCKRARQLRERIEDLNRMKPNGCRRARDVFYETNPEPPQIDCNKFVGEDGFPPRRGDRFRSGTGGVGGRNTYENGKRIPGNFPAAYQNSLNEAVPDGQKCGNCKFFNQNSGYCSVWKATANKVYWCQSYVPYVNITKNGAAVSSSGGVFSLRDSNNNLITYKKGTTVIYNGELYEVTKTVFGQSPDSSSSFTKITNIDDNVIDGGSFGGASRTSNTTTTRRSSGGSSSSSSSSGGGY